MDPKTSYEINNLRILNDYLTQTIEVMARAQRFGMNRDFGREMGLSHSHFVPGVFGMPAQGIGVDPRVADFNSGFSHSPYNYPYDYTQRQFGGVPGVFPTNVDPWYATRGLSHTPGTHWGSQPWSPYAAAEIARQRELSSLLARQQYEAMWRPFGV